MYTTEIYYISQFLNLNIREEMVWSWQRWGEGTRLGRSSSHDETRWGLILWAGAGAEISLSFDSIHEIEIKFNNKNKFNKM